jgi:Peptidase family M23
MKRLVALLPVLIALQAGVPPALAWTWPVDGPVLRPFVLGDDPYAAGQHRGIDVGSSANAPVRAPAAGTVSFAGTVPGGGRTLAVRTPDGYSVTLVHLGSTAVARGAEVAAGDVVGTMGPSGEPELPQPYVHLGVRRAADPNGYLDPLAFLPARAAGPSGNESPDGESPEESPAEETGGQAPAPEAPAPTSPAQPALEGPAQEGVAPGAPAESARSSNRRHAGRELPSAALGPSSPPLARIEAASPPRAQAGPARPPRTGRFSFENPAASAPSEESPPFTSIRFLGHALAGHAREAGAAGTGLAALIAVAASVCLAVRRRQLGDARTADRPSAMLLDRGGLAAEDAGRLRPAQEDCLVLDRDLERILLGEPEPLSNLDRDDDPSELVDAPDDPGRTHSLVGARGCAH